MLDKGGNKVGPVGNAVRLAHQIVEQSSAGIFCHARRHIRKMYKRSKSLFEYKVDYLINVYIGNYTAQYFCLCDVSTRRGWRNLRGGIAESAAAGCGEKDDLFAGEIIRFNCLSYLSKKVVSRTGHVD